MKRKKWISLTMALIMVGNLLPMQLKADAASISDEVREDIIAINSYLQGILVGTEAVDINEDGCINAVDLTLAKRDLLGDNTPALKPLRADTWDIYLNEEATVTFTVQTVSITDPVILYDEADDVLAEMHDDGKNGDKTAGDSIYTATAVLSSDKTKNAGYYAAAGELRSEPFEICFYRDMEDEDISGFLTLFWKISEMSFDEASEFIMQSDEISSFSADEELKQIWYQSVYGIQGCFEEPQESEEQTLGSGVRIDISDGGYDYKAAEEYIEANTFTPAHPDKRDVIVLRPFQKNLPKPVFSRAGELLANALDGSLTELDDQDVTLEQLKNLDSYGTVLLNTHGVLVDSNRDESIPSVIYLLTGESVPNGNIDIAFPWQSYSADFWAGRVACFGAGSSYRISVSYKFFDKYYASGSLDQSFWFLGACYSLHNYQLADTLISKGAGAVIGYSDVTSTHYCYKTMLETVINSMVLNAENVKKAVLESKARYGYFDPYNPENEMRFRGRPHFKLVEAAGDNTVL
ncbi:MAG: hypothetical protein IKH27_14250 [Oscillospiraceae bacterium]|nr:hypothetical protein [Oscillospiraceae bacterium]MBR3448955.1 hypothetical protein [Oscillospiraceae bacterium]